MDNPILTEAIELSEYREVTEARHHLRAEWLRLYLAARPYSAENIRQRAAICAKMKKWRSK
jgi:hypothetical protein